MFIYYYVKMENKHLSIYLSICVVWQKAVRIIYNMHPATHSDIITALAGQVPLWSNLKVRLCQFFAQAKYC